jgi:hypothetical protein
MPIKWPISISSLFAGVRNRDIGKPDCYTYRKKQGSRQKEGCFDQYRILFDKLCNNFKCSLFQK